MAFVGTPLKNTKERYGSVAQFFHWSVALGILLMLPLGAIMYKLPVDTADAVALKVWLYSLHKTIGVGILALAVLRIAWALYSPRPKPLHPERKLETFAAETAHWLLYGSIILIPVTGFLHHAATSGFAPIWWPFGQSLPFVPKDEAVANVLKLFHWAFSVLLLVTLAAHIGGALKHKFIDKDLTLARMLPVGSLKGMNLNVHSSHSNHFAPSVLAFIVFLAVGGVVYLTQVKTTNDITARESVSKAPSDLAANQWQVDYEKSKLAIEASQLGSAIQGSFDDWQADITFDSEALGGAKAKVTINTGSLTLGSVSADAIGPDFLAAEMFPTAIFETTSFSKTGDKRYEAVADLTIKDVVQTIVLPFDLTIEDDVANMSGALTINRLDFGVGAEKYPDESSAGFEVTIKVDIIAMRASTE